MKRQILCAITLLVAIGLCGDRAAAQTQVADHPRQITSGAAESNFFTRRMLATVYRPGFRLRPASNRLASESAPVFTITPLVAGPNLPVVGSGIIGRLPKWTALTPGNSVIGNSTIFEDKFGLVGIGTDSPTSRLTVLGLIESKGAGGGVKFPDGTVQTTAALNAIFHDATLAGDGTAASPLGVAVPLILSGTPLAPVLSVTNLSPGRSGIKSIGGNSVGSPGGQGMEAVGGNGTTGGGIGVSARGGDSDGTAAGFGVRATGGNTMTSSGGIGVGAIGGNAISGSGGAGLVAVGGPSDSGTGGDGIFVTKGNGPMGDGLAGNFFGDVEVSGMLSKGGGSFKIDHPLDPENKYLYHSFVESPDMKNIYDGNIVTDANGDATVELPAYFEALNRDCRYQLTVVGTFAQAIVAEEVKDNHFRIRTSAPNVKVSWQVTGIRQDGWANRNRIKVEVEKPERERGYYLHPEAFDQTEERGIEWARHPEMMQQRKAARAQAKRKPQ